jgi:MerR family transcriptional regulator, light-induced transcriptional regulator
MARERAVRSPSGGDEVPADHHDETRSREMQLAAELQRAFADALLAGDERAAETVVREAIDAGLDEALIDDHIIGPALVLVGDLWADGSISVGEEHLATAISVRVLTLHREAFRVARRRASQLVLLAAAQGEQHVVGLEMASSVLQHAGYDVRLFGADLPVEAIAPAVAKHRPAVVGFTSATVLTAVNLPAAFEAVRTAAPDVAIVVGGRGVGPELATRWDVAVCAHVSDAVAQVDALVKRARHN